MVFIILAIIANTIINLLLSYYHYDYYYCDYMYLDNHIHGYNNSCHVIIAI